jgi:hypothetical protein
MILAYRARDGAYNIVQLGLGGPNIFMFRITNGFGEPAPGQIVAVSLPAGVTDSGGGVYTADANGLINIELTTVLASAVPTVATLTVGKTSRTFTLGSTVTGHLRFSTSGGLPFVTPADPGYTNDVIGYQSTATVTVTEYDDGSDVVFQSLPVGATVLWSVKAVGNPSAAWWLRGEMARNGLTWGDNADGTSSWAVDDVVGTASPSDTVKLTDIVGSRSVTLEASVCIGGSVGNETTDADCTANGGVWYTDETTVSFGAGPLSVFTTNPNDGRVKAWAALYGTSAGTGNGDFTSAGNFFPAAGIAHGSVRNDTVLTSGSTPNMTATFGVGWTAGEITDGHYSTTAKLPKVSQLLAVAKYNGGYNGGVLRKGAAFAAGWPDDNWNGGNGSGWYEYWSGEVFFNGVYGYFNARVVLLEFGNDGWDYVFYDGSVAVGVLP